MNDIKELEKIIQSLGGSATSEDIVNEYCRIHHMVVQPHYKKVVEKTLASSGTGLHKNKALNTWDQISGTDEYIYISDNRYFQTIQDAMLSVFNKKVSSYRAYFSVNDNHAVWFPQPKNDNWENTMSDDGRFWYEKAKPGTDDYTPDYKLRYVFVHDAEGYRFTGLFKTNENQSDGTHVYELVDDKVCVIKPRPYLMVCRVAYMKYYDGITENDVPVNGGSYVDKTSDAMEKNNFHRYDDGNCYIYIETKYKKGHTGDHDFAKKIVLENIDPAYKDKDCIEGVRVVLTATSPVLNKSVVVGWYDDVTVFRDRIICGDMIYMMRCSFENAHLIPDVERSFEIPIARGNDYGIGQNNFWYIQKADAAREFEARLIKYLEGFKNMTEQS